MEVSPYFSFSFFRLHIIYLRNLYIYARNITSIVDVDKLLNVIKVPLVYNLN